MKLTFKYADLRDSFDKVNAFFADEKQQPALMMKIDVENSKAILGCAVMGSVGPAYSATSASDVEIELESAVVDNGVEVVPAEKVLDTLFFDMVRFKDIIDACKDSGRILVEDVEFDFGSTDATESRMVTVHCEKKMEMAVSGQESTELKVISEVNQELNFRIPSDNNNRDKGVLRAEFNTIFNPTNDTVETWEVEDLASILNQFSPEKSNIIYISGTRNSVLMAGTSNTHIRPLTNVKGELLDINNTLLLSSDEHKKLCSVLSKIKGSLSVWIEKIEKTQICFMFNDEGFGIQFIMAKGSSANIGTFDHFTKDRNYNFAQVTFVNEAYKDVINAVMSTSGKDAEKTIVSFNNAGSEDEPDWSMILSGNNHLKSKKNTYNIKAYSFNHCEDGIDIQFETNTKLLKEVASKLNSMFIGFDFCKDDNDSNNLGQLRISEICLDKYASAREKYCNEHGIDVSELTQEDKMLIRDGMLGTQIYLDIKM